MLEFYHGTSIDSDFVDLRSVVELKRYERLVLTIALIMAWLRFLEPTQLVVEVRWGMRLFCIGFADLLLVVEGC